MKAKLYKTKKSRPVSAPERLSPEVLERFAVFVEYHPAGRLSRNLRKMLLDFLMTGSGIESLYLEDLIFDLEGLFSLLDTLEDAGLGSP